MLNIFKKGHTTLVSDIDAWAVKWNQRYGIYMGDYRETVQFFTSKEEAEAFADSLKRAIKLLGHTSGHLKSVSCEKVRKSSL